MPYCLECGGEFEPDVEVCPDCGLALVENIPAEYPNADPDADLVEVYTASGDIEALVIKGLLESEGIMCSLSSDVPHSIVPVEVDGLGAVRISVSDEDAERAAQLIASHEEENDISP
jgi:hypothetical protein